MNGYLGTNGTSKSACLFVCLPTCLPFCLSTLVVTATLIVTVSVTATETATAAVPVVRAAHAVCRRTIAVRNCPSLYTALHVENIGVLGQSAGEGV